MRRAIDRPISIGRGADCDIRLEAATVSIRHAVVSASGGQVQVDAGSSLKGIDLGGRRVRGGTLSPGQSFGIEGTSFRVVADEAAPSPDPVVPSASTPLAPAAAHLSTPYYGSLDPEAYEAALRANVVAGAGQQNLRPLLFIFLGGGLILVALIGVLAWLLFLNESPKPGGITFSPFTVTCSRPADWTMDIKLPASLKSSDIIEVDWGDLDWQDGPLTSVRGVFWSGSWIQLSDGSWQGHFVMSAKDVQLNCYLDNEIASVWLYPPMAFGDHKVEVRAHGDVIATGSYTIER